MVKDLSLDKQITQLNQRLGYGFRDHHLFEEAFRHSSYVNETGNALLKDNERLEFLGDAVLDLAIGHILMDFFQEAREGDLSKYRARIVNERELYKVAKGLDLGDFICLGRGEEMSGGRKKPSILADALEALVGAIYLDSGFEKTKEVVRRLFLPLLFDIKSMADIDDFKSLLQEYTQEQYKTRPEYLLVSETGPPHDKTFVVAIRIHDGIVAEGAGKSKKEAEQRAAREAFFCLKEEEKGT